MELQDYPLGPSLTFREDWCSNMKILEEGIEISETERLVLEEEVEEISSYIKNLIKIRAISSANNIYSKYKHEIEEDNSIQSLPKCPIKLAELIMSRPWFKSRKALSLESQANSEAKFEEM